MTYNSIKITPWVLLVVFFALFGCSKNNPEEETSRIPIPIQCGEMPTTSEESPYVLPFPVGTSYFVNQANCSGFGHRDYWLFGYDFTMDIGTIVTAARGGRVGWAIDGCPDGNRTCTNLVTIIHDDGTVALYSHLTINNLRVKTGDMVKAGDTIGKSGDTGNTGGLPHLHFSVHPCNEFPGLNVNPGCGTIPANFSNTDPNDTGLSSGRFYKALPY